MDNLTAPANLTSLKDVWFPLETPEIPQNSFPLEGTDEAQGVLESPMASDLEVKLDIPVYHCYLLLYYDM